MRDPEAMMHNSKHPSGLAPWPLTISTYEAAAIVGKSRDTVIRWVLKYGIGKRMDSRSEWRIDPLGLAMVANGDADALKAWQAGDLDAQAVRKYGPFSAQHAREAGAQGSVKDR
jgi:hypothetical protein